MRRDTEEVAQRFKLLEMSSTCRVKLFGNGVFGAGGIPHKISKDIQ